MSGELDPVMGESAKPKGKGDEDPDEAGGSKAPLIIVFGVILLVPAAVLFWRYFVRSSVCNSDESTCLVECQTAFDDPNRRWMSQLALVNQCRAICKDKAMQCHGQAGAVMVAAMLLACGYLLAILMFFLLEGTMARFSANMAKKSPGAGVRASAVEPFETEEDQRRKKERRRKWPWDRPEEIRVIRAKCRDCDIPVEIDQKWIKGEKGGMEGARCPRCGKVIVGVL